MFLGHLQLLDDTCEPKKLLMYQGEMDLFGDFWPFFLRFQCYISLWLFGLRERAIRQNFGNFLNFPILEKFGRISTPPLTFFVMNVRGD